MNEDSRPVVRIRRVDVFVYRHPIAKPVVNSFGVMRDRRAVFVRLEDGDGRFGWGEIFANWPAAGPEHRANLLLQDFADLMLGCELRRPQDLLRKLEPATRIRAMQCGEPGPFRQVTAGLDTAVWDLFARRAGMPLRCYLNPAASDRVPAYASGIQIRDAGTVIPNARSVGFRNFKVKVGFNMASDIAGIREALNGLDAGERLFSDANQAWDLNASRTFLDGVAGLGLGWLEEPMPVDAPDNDWRALAKATDVPIAGGENIAGQDGFADAIALGALKVVQPDVAKWGGVTGCFEVARQAVAARRTYCPHFLGGGIGLIASAHLLAAAGGDGVLEVDANPNPLRELLASSQDRLEDGQWRIPDAPGLGIETLPAGYQSMLTFHDSMRAED